MIFGFYRSIFIGGREVQGVKAKEWGTKKDENKRNYYINLCITNNLSKRELEREIKNKEINITVLSKGTYTILIIEDNAGGVKLESLEKLFDPYYTTKPYGTGTGLYMVKLVIKNSFSGDLKVNNSEKGLRYIIALPQKRQDKIRL